MGSTAFGMEKSAPDTAEAKPNLGCCCICKDDIYPAHAITITSCGHIFHTSCLNESLCHGTTCPLCRADLTAIITLAQQTAQRIHEAEGIIERIRLDHEAAMRMTTEGHPAPEAATPEHERTRIYNNRSFMFDVDEIFSETAPMSRRHEEPPCFAEFFIDENGYIVTNFFHHDRS